MGSNIYAANARSRLRLAGARASLSQSAAWAALGGHIGLGFDKSTGPTPHGPKHLTPRTAQEPARAPGPCPRRTRRAWPRVLLRACKRGGGSGPFGSSELRARSLACRCQEFRGALPALAPEHGTVERSMRLESEVIAPACHQKKIPPPGKTSRAGNRIRPNSCTRSSDGSSAPHARSFSSPPLLIIPETVQAGPVATSRATSLVSLRSPSKFCFFLQESA